MNEGTREHEVLQRIQEHLKAIDPHLDVSTIVLSASLSQQLGLDSLRMASLFDRIRQDHAGLNLLPWFMNAARQGGDSLESLVTFVVNANEQSGNGKLPRGRGLDVAIANE